MESLKKLPPSALEKLASMPELEPEAQPAQARRAGARSPSSSPPGVSQSLRAATDDFSDSEDEEIDVGD